MSSQPLVQIYSDSPSKQTIFGLHGNEDEPIREPLALMACPLMTSPLGQKRVTGNVL
jgi:hypothetical protein